MKKSNRGNHLFFKYFVTYFIVLLIPFLLGCLYYQRCASIIYDDTVEINVSALHHSATITDIQFNEIDAFAEQIILNPDVTNFQSNPHPFEYPNTYSVYELSHMLSNNYSCNQSIDQYFLFFHNNKTCITPKYAYQYHKFYEIYHKDTDLTYDEWLTQLQGLCSAPVYLLADFPSAEQKITRLAYARPLLSVDNSTGLLLVFLDDNHLANLFSAIDISDGGSLYIQNRVGNILYSDSTSKVPVSELQQIISENNPHDMKIDEPYHYQATIDGQDMLITGITTSANNLTYMFVQKSSSIIARANSIKMLMIFILFISFIVGSLLCYLMSKKSSRPLNALLEIFPSADMEPSIDAAFEQIRSSYYEMVSQSQTAKETLSGQLPYLKRAFMEQLLQNDFSSIQEMQTIADYIHFDYHSKSYTVLIFRIHSSILPTQEIDFSYYVACRIAVMETLSVLLPDSLCIERDSDQIICLYTMKETQTVYLQAEIQHLVTKMSSALPLEIYSNLQVLAGNTVMELQDVPHSFTNCLSMLSNRSFTPEGLPIQWYDSDNITQISYYYPYEVRANIVRFVLGGESQALHDVLSSLLSRNIIDSALPPLIFQMFLNELITTIYHIITRLNLQKDVYQNLYQELETLSHQDDLQKTHNIVTLFNRLCSYAASQAELNESSFIHSVTAYIQQNFFSPELSLTAIATHFHVNESYLSTAFKKHTGTKFSSYLENLRMEYAKDLLYSTDRTIADIAEASGYYSSTSFCRAFKRYFNCTPTQCRNGDTSS